MSTYKAWSSDSDTLLSESATGEAISFSESVEKESRFVSDLDMDKRYATKLGNLSTPQSWAFCTTLTDALFDFES